MKLIDQSRLIAAHSKLTKFAYRLTHKEGEVMKAAFAYGLKSALHEQNNVVPEPTRERDVLRLTCDYHEVFSFKDSLDLETQFRHKIDRIQGKRSRLDAIQWKYKISGLRREECKFGDAAIERWHPVGDLDLLDADLDLLKSDRSRIVQFWVDHALLNGLTPYYWCKDKDDSWVPVDLDFCRLASTEYEWADTWQYLIWIDRKRRRAPLGYAIPLETDTSPQKGYTKHHELHLRVANGTHWDDPEKSIWFCACNERPFS